MIGAAPATRRAGATAPAAAVAVARRPAGNRPPRRCPRRPVARGPAARPPPAGGQPSRRTRLGLVALAALAVLFLLVQVLAARVDDDATVADPDGASSTTTPATRPAAPSAAASWPPSCGTAASRLGPGDGSGRTPTWPAGCGPSPTRSSGATPAAGTAATGLIVDVARWRQAGQLADGATVTAIQLLQKVPGVAVVGPTAARQPADGRGRPAGQRPAGKDKDKGKGKDEGRLTDGGD